MEIEDRRANEATMHRLINVIWNGRDLDRLPEVFTANATIHHGDHPMMGIPVFREEYMRPFQVGFSDLRHDIEDLIFDGDKVAMRFRGCGTHDGVFREVKPTGKTLKYRGIAIFRMEAGLIAEVWVHSDSAEALAEILD